MCVSILFGMAAALNRKIARRKALRVSFERHIAEVKTSLTNPESTQAKFLGLKNKLNEAYENLGSIDEEIINLLDPENIEVDVLDSEKIVESFHELLAEITLKLNSVKISDSDKHSDVSSMNRNCKLPKLELPVFMGNPLKWQGFWDQFNVAINENNTLSDIDRFNYLKKYLAGQALATISGFTLSSDNYNEAINVLVERYGNPQVLISAHMDALLNMKKIKSFENLEGLRKLYNDVESCVRNLKSLKVEVSTYGCLLIPILKDRLPEELILIISRKFAGNIWTLDVLLKYFHDELQAKENCFLATDKYAKSDFKIKGSESNRSYTAAGLHAQQNNRQHAQRCVYCLENHAPSQCKKVTNIKSRFDILKRYGKCYICLNSGHIARKCPSDYVCRKCNGGKHHISVCNKEKSENSVVSHVEASTSILLQTARATILNIDESQSLTSRILFDSGSQRTYVTDNVRKQLKLKTIRKENIMIKTFGQINDSEMKSLDVVQFKVKYRSENKYVFVEALCVPVICSPLTKQYLSLAQRKFDHVSKLDLADFNDRYGESSVGILVGVDLYHSFISGKVIKSTSGPVASASVLGWVLSGPVSSENCCSTQFCFETHSMRCDVRGTGEEVDELRSDLMRFWSAETVGKSDECVIHEFERKYFITVRGM